MDGGAAADGAVVDDAVVATGSAGGAGGGSDVDGSTVVPVVGLVDDSAAARPTLAPVGPERRTRSGVAGAVGGASSSPTAPGTAVVVLVELALLMVVVVAVVAGSGRDAVETVTPSVPQDVRTSASSTNRAANADVRNERVMGSWGPVSAVDGDQGGSIAEWLRPGH